MIYVTDGRRRDGLGAARNMLTARAITGPRLHPGHGPIVAALTPQPSDIVIERAHGMTGFHTTALDQYLRNLGITSVVITGVSANVAVNGTAIEAMNRGYRVIVPSDGIAGDPPEYVEMLLRHTIRNVALVAPTQPIVEYWDSLPSLPSGEK